MNVHERLRASIDQRQDRLRAEVPSDRQAAILALLSAQDQLSHSPAIEPLPNLITGCHFANLGGSKALQLCFESTGNDAQAASASSGEGLDGWGEWFLQECGQLAEAELILAHRETGFMGLVEDDNETFHAWIATKRAPASWRERADIDWWATWLAKRHEPELTAARS
ncbi:MAG: hypothetical protein M3R06_04210, partial [Chloroflexota bacterium]|nr:hypothetical protein [Chloroflexota bacterium]